MKVKKIYKFATGEAIPEGAVYLSTVTQTQIVDVLRSGSMSVDRTTPCWYVWHYFLVEVEIK